MPPKELETSVLLGCLADCWGFDARAVDYAAVGGGSYHWVVAASGGRRAFVTVDDLDTKPWLEGRQESVFDGLRRAYDTAVALRDSGGLDCVVAPIPTEAGETALPIGARHTIALFPFVAGQVGRYGDDESIDRAAVVTMLARLHGAPAAIASMAGRIDLQLPGRRYLEAGLDELDQTWLGGPFSEPARHVFARHASDVTELLALFDRLRATVASRSTSWVVTHGEPHAANVMRCTDGRSVLVDWDTVAVAPPERDLWMHMDDTADDHAARYTAATGYRPDRAALDFFRLTWDLGDLASFTKELRSPHRENEDTTKAYEGLSTCLAVRPRWEPLLG